MGTGINRHAPYSEQTLERTLTPTEIRTLNSVPINLVVPANAKTFLAPMQCVFVGSKGSGAYSVPPGPALQYSDGAMNASLDGGSSWDGTSLAFAVTADMLVAYDTQDMLAQIGLALQVTSGTDATGGDAPFKIKLVYRAYDLTGDL